MTWSLNVGQTLKPIRQSLRTAGAWCALLLCGLGVAGGEARAQGAEQLRLSLGQSIVIDYPDDIRQVSTTDPVVADYTVISTRQILVLAKGLGTTDIVVWSADGERMFYNVTVGLNIESLRRMLRETFPAETIDVRTSGDSISLSGEVARQEVVDRAVLLASVVSKNVVNNLRVPAAPVEKQVLLRVRFAELDRQRASDLGVNLNSVATAANPLGALNTIGSITTGAFASGFNLQAFRQDLNLDIMLKALQSQNILQLLSEPNLVASNKQEASFLVGGEFPIPVVQGGGNSNAVTIQFREFGIRLKFKPEITPNDTIRLTLNQEVSTIDFTVGISFNGTSIPGLATRRAETLVELADGQSFIVAGLLDNQAREQFQKIPGIGNIPILGSLFKSKSENKNSRELVMLVTPMITNPLNVSEAAPEIDFPIEFLKGAADDLRGERKPANKTAKK